MSTDNASTNRPRPRRERVSSGTKWETIMGYSRAVKAGHHIYVSGTTSTDMSGNLLHKGEAYDQTLRALDNIERAISEFDADRRHIVRTRVYVTNIYDWEVIAKAHGEFFKDINPVTTMVEVRRLIEPEMLVEIEADAYLDPNEV
jgi:enamine deaminase RidA (YjgF/YER057c/UK114 family)